jgi:hypothetical protein
MNPGLTARTRRPDVHTARNVDSTNLSQPKALRVPQAASATSRTRRADEDAVADIVTKLQVDRQQIERRMLGQIDQ